MPLSLFDAVLLVCVLLLGIQVDAVVVVRVSGVVRERVVARRIQVDAEEVVVRCGVVRERVVARRIQGDAVVVVRCVVIGDVAVIHAASKIYSRLVACRVRHCEPGDVHVILSYIKDLVAWIRCVHDAVRRAVL